MKPEHKGEERISFSQEELMAVGTREGWEFYHLPPHKAEMFWRARMRGRVKLQRLAEVGPEELLLPDGWELVNPPTPEAAVVRNARLGVTIQIPRVPGTEPRDNPR